MEKRRREPVRLINPYEEAEKQGLVSDKKKVNLATLEYRDRRTEFWPDAPKDVLETHPLARKAHVYGSSL